MFPYFMPNITISITEQEKEIIEECCISPTKLFKKALKGCQLKLKNGKNGRAGNNPRV